MSATDAIASVLVEYLQSVPDAQDPIDVETDLLESGRLDSLLVMDLVCFVEDRFHVRMQPCDIDPRNLRSVRRLAHYIHAKSSCGAQAA